MLSYRTQTKLGQLIENIAINNRKLEVQRQILAEQPEFEPYTTFKRLDCLRKGSIDNEDIISFMNDNEIYINRNDGQKVINYLDINQNRIVTYTEFSKQILPKEHATLKQVASSRQPYPLDRDQKLEYEVEWSLAKIFQQLIRQIDEKTELLDSLQESYDYNSRECFMTIDQLDRGSINSLQMDKFLNRCDIFISDEEFDSFFVLVDIDQDGLVIYREFVAEVLTLHNLNPSRSLTRSVHRSPTKGMDRSTTRLERSVNRLNRSNRMDRSITKRGNDMDLNQEYREYTSSKRSLNQSLYNTPSKQSMNRSFNKTMNRSFNKSLNRSMNKSMNKSMNRSPLKPNDQYQLTKALKKQIEIDKEIEENKKALSLKSDFNLLDGFRMLDLEGKGFISNTEFREAVYEMGVNISRDECHLVFKRYDKDNDSLLKYSDFCRMISPVNKQYNDILKSKEPTYNNHQILSWESKKGLKRLLNLVIDGELQSEILRQQLQSRPSFNVIDAFDTLDQNENGFITPNEFRCMLENYSIYVSQKDIDILINRYDKNNDGRVSYSEFCNEILPKSPKKL